MSDPKTAISAGLFVLSLLLGAAWAGPTTRPAGRSPTSQPASSPSSRPVTAVLVRRLVRQLGASQFRRRQAAQKQLSDMGEAALPYLIDFIGCADAEVSNRIAAIVKRPTDPALRVEVAVRLLATADPDQMESGVYMLFESPIEDYDLFVRRTQNARGLERAIFQPVAERLAIWKEITERFNRRQERLRREKPAAAARELKLYRGSKYYQAEAAYWPAIEAAQAYSPQERPNHRATSQPR